MRNLFVVTILSLSKRVNRSLKESSVPNRYSSSYVPLNFEQISYKHVSTTSLSAEIKRDHRLLKIGNKFLL